MAENRSTKVLVAGNGVAGLETVLALQSLARGRVDIEMLAPERHFTYRPLAAGAPFLCATPARTELAGIARDRGFRLTRDVVDRVDPTAHEVVTQEGTRIPYDVLVLALRAHPIAAVEGAVPFRGSSDRIAVADALEARAVRVEDADRRVTGSGELPGDGQQVLEDRLEVEQRDE